MLLDNKVSIVTGCNRGIGKSILEIFSENGASIIACVRKVDEQFSDYIIGLEKKYKNKIIPVSFNFENIEEVKKAAKEIIEKNKNIEILVNNAGIIDTYLFQMTTEKNLKKMFEVNFFSQMIFTQLIVKGMMKNKKGNIVNISSSAAIDGNYGRSSYAASKAAIIANTKVISRELGAFNIRVNAVAPGTTNTDMLNKNSPKDLIEDFVKRTSLRRVGNAEEIAKVVLFLSSDLSSYVTGQTIRVDGGI
tara:strand:- start:22425 stop:23168 length:744 start_codon:yes stop_codon:yes gene_type:complete